MRAATNLGRVTTVKDAAYAWRQAIFFLSLLPVAELGERLESFRRLPLASQWPMTEVIEGLASVVAGDQSVEVRPFLGWSVGTHWTLSRRRRSGEMGAR